MKVFAFILCFFIFYSADAQPLAPSWKFHHTLPSGLNGHKSVTLPDGNILIAGGINSSGSSQSVTYIYNYSSGALTQISNLKNSRFFHSLISVPLSSDMVRIFAIGGYSGNGGSYQSINSIEYLDYSIGQASFQWKEAGNLNQARADFGAAYSQNGFITVAGGFAQNSGAIRSGQRLKSCEIINISSFQIFQIADLNKARAGQLLGLIINDAGKNQIICAGGEDNKSPGTELLNNNIWDAFANPPKNFRDFAINFADKNGIARMFGGISDANATLNTCEWYDVKSGWKYAPSMTSARANANIIRIAGLKDDLNLYLTAGGSNNSGFISQSEYFSPPNINEPSGSWIQFYPLQYAGANRTLNIAGNNLPLAIGGDNGSPIDNIEIFQPIRANSANFGSEEIGRVSDSLVITLKNEWLLPVRLTDFRIDKSAEFFFTGDTSSFILQAGAERKIFVRFIPNDAGLRQSRLLFNIGGLIDTINLSGTGITSSIAIITKNVSFGEILVGKDTTVCFSAIKNNGTDTTYIDSISVAPQNVYQLISPKGRVKIAPNQEIQMCVKFIPNRRDSIFGTALLNLGARKFPCSFAGKGIQKFIKGFASTNCDTVAYTPNSTYQKLITIINESDKDVKIGKFTFTGGAVALFSYNGTYSIPINKGARKDFYIDFKPNGEGLYQTTLIANNDGDSAVNIPICFVVRSRTLSFDQQNIDYGLLCVGDSLVRELIIENPSLYDSLKIDSITLNNNSPYFYISALTKQNLAPLEKTKLTLSYAPKRDSIINDKLNVYGSFGISSIGITAIANPTVQPIFQDSLFYVYLGDNITLPISLNWNSSNSVSLQSANMILNFDESLTKLNRLLTYDNGNQLDLNQCSFVRLNTNKYLLKLKWLAPLTVSGINTIGLEFEALLGSSYYGKIELESYADSSYCFDNSSTLLVINEKCGGKGGLLSPKSYNIISLSSNSISKELTVKMDKFDEGELSHQIYNTLGEIVLNQESYINKNVVKTESINIERLCDGLYLYRIVHKGNVVFNEKIILSK